MTALLVIAIIVGAVVAFSAVAETIRRLRKAARLERAIEAHNRDEADLEAMADATREAPPLTDKQADELARLLRRNEEPQ